MDEATLQLHKRATVVDAHIDTLLEIMVPPARPIKLPTPRKFGERSSKGHVDLPRLLESGVDLQIFAVYIQPEYKIERALHRALQVFDRFYKELHDHEDKMMLFTKVSDVREAEKQGKIAAMLSIEGGEAVEADLGILRMLYKLGLRAMTLTWNERNQIADGAGEGRTKGGLTNFGVELVKEMNNLGMVVDVSHLNDAGFFDVIETTTKPIIASHSNCRAVCNHRRNLTDDMIKILADNGGVMGMNFAPSFVDENKENATLERVLDHVDHIVKVASVDNVGLGSDFDGIETTPKGLEDVTRMPYLTEGLLKRGYKEDDIRKVLGENFLRVFRQVIG
ncbi:MAG TPA: dipeptidase [Candidatus Bathyarchaeia archaeon]|nr:dipeptidase [Candidatus Bathyarchaeia archaeon]